MLIHGARPRRTEINFSIKSSLLALLFVGAVFVTPQVIAQQISLTEIQEKIQTAQVLRQEARAALEQKLAVDPTDVSARFTLAELWRSEKQWDLARAAYERVMAQDPRHALAHLRLGEIYSEDWDLERSTQEIEQSLRLAQENALIDFPWEEAYRLLAERYEKDEDYEQAAQYYARILQQNSQDSVAQLAFAKMRYYLNDYPRAEEALRQLIATNHQDAAAHYYLGLVLQAQDKTAAAQKEFVATLAVDPTYADAYNWLAFMSKKEGDWLQAKKYYRSLVDLSPHYGQQRLELAKIYVQDQEFPEAIAQIQSIQPNRYNQKIFQEGQHLLIHIYQSMGNREAARRVFWSLDPQLGIKLLGLGGCLLAPAGLLFLFGKRVQQRLDPNEGPRRVLQYQSLKRFALLMKILGIVALIILVVGGLSSWLDYFRISYFVFFFISILFVGFSVQMVLALFDRHIRGVSASGKEYALAYGKSLLMAIIFWGALWGVYWLCQKFGPTPQGVAGCLLLLAIIVYGYFGCLPWFIRVLNKTLPWEDGALLATLNSWVKRLQIDCAKITLIKTDQFRASNALAAGIFPKKQEVIIFNHLLHRLSTQEVEAIFLHELGHLKFGHVRIRAHLTFVVFLGVLLFPQLNCQEFMHQGILVLIAIAIYVLSVGIIYRNQEKQADAFVVEHYPHPEFLLSALEKIYADNYIPATMKASSHPTLVKRLEFIRYQIVKKSNVAS